MSVSTALPLSPMPPSAATAESNLLSLGLGQSLGQDASISPAGASFGSLLDQGTGQSPSKSAESVTAQVIPSGIPFTVGCIAQLVSQQGMVQEGNPSPAMSQTAQELAAQTVPAGQQPAVSPSPIPPGKVAGKGASTSSATVSASMADVVPGAPSGQGSAATSPRVVKRKTDEEPADDAAGEGDVAKEEARSFPQSEPTAAVISSPEVLAMFFQPQAAPQPIIKSGDWSLESAPTAGASCDTPSSPQPTIGNWAPLKPDATVAGIPQDQPEPLASAPLIKADQDVPASTGVLAFHAASSSAQPQVRTTKALAAYDAGLQPAAIVPPVQTGEQVVAKAGILAQNQNPAQAPGLATAQANVQGIPQASPQAAPMLRNVTEASVLGSRVAPKESAPENEAISTLSMESSVNTPATAKDGNAKDGTQAALRAGDSTPLSPRANSAAQVQDAPRTEVATSEKKSQNIAEKQEADTVKTDGIRNAKSDASMSINRRTRTFDARDEASLAPLGSPVPAARPDSEHLTSKVAVVDSAQRAVATVSELVDRMQARPATKVAIDVPLSGDQNVSVKLEYKAGVLHVNFRTDSAELRDALSREWSSVAAQSGSALRNAEPTFNSNSSDHNQQQSKADAFDMGWNRQGQQQQQRAQQQQEQGPRSFTLPGSRSTSSSAMDGVSNRDRTTASRQVAPDTTRHLNVVA